MTTRRFEFQAGSSAKFWQIAVVGSEHRVTYGRLGTDGRSLTKAFASEAAAELAANKLIAQKRGKGYVEVGAAREPEEASGTKAKTKAAKAPKTTTAPRATKATKALEPTRAKFPRERARGRRAKTGSAETLTGPSGETVVYDVDASPDGRFIAGGGVHSNHVFVWERESGKLVAHRRCVSGRALARSSGTTVRFSPDGKTLLARCNSRTFELEVGGWKPTERKDLRTAASSGLANGLDVGAGGVIALDEENSLHVRRPDAAMVQERLKSIENTSMVAVSPDGKHVCACASPAEVRLVATGKLKRRLNMPKVDGHPVGANWAAWFPDNRHLAVAFATTLGVGIYDLRKATLVRRMDDAPNRRRYRGNTCVAVDPRGEHIATTRDDDQTVRLWRLDDGSLVGELKGHATSHHETNPFHALRCRFTPDGTQLIVNAGLQGRAGAVTLHRVEGANDAPAMDATTVETEADHVEAFLERTVQALERARGNRKATRSAIEDYLAAGTALGLSPAHLHDHFGVSSPSLPQRAGYTSRQTASAQRLFTELAATTFG